EERPADEEVVMTLDEGRRRLKPRERFDPPIALRAQPAPDAGARGEPVGGVGFEDDESISHGLRLFECGVYARPHRVPTGVDTGLFQLRAEHASACSAGYQGGVLSVFL